MTVVLMLGIVPTVLAAEASRETDSHVRAAWYADGSCLLRIDQAKLIGVTGIDADMGAEGARTMVHCDVDTGQRLTVLARGDGLAIGERVVLADPAEIEDSVNGSVAWIALHDDTVPPENTPRRFLINGRILIRETPAVSVAGTAVNADKLPFAEIVGRLQPLKRHPDPQEPNAAAQTVDPEGVTRMACRVRPCVPLDATLSAGTPVEPKLAPATLKPIDELIERLSVDSPNHVTGDPTGDLPEVPTDAPVGRQAIEDPVGQPAGQPTDAGQQ